MQITTRTWNNYIARLSRLNEAAGQKMREYIRLHNLVNFIKTTELYILKECNFIFKIS